MRELTADEAFEKAFGGERTLYPYQRRLAEEGLPTVLAVPTSSGKTLAAGFAWLYRRCLHPDEEVRRSTPRTLMFVQPMRSLVEQSFDTLSDLVERCELSGEVSVLKLMGGESVTRLPWVERPGSLSIVVTTLDMALSRALNRGYGESRWTWPMSFGAVNNDVLWVFDEPQLMGVALSTSRQLQALRDRLGTYGTTSSMWMSATIDLGGFSTVDNPWRGDEPVVRLSTEDLAGGLAERVHAPKRWICREGGATPKELAAIVASEHLAGTLTILVCNRVQTAREVAALLRPRGRKAGAVSAPVVLLHRRFRPGDRAAAFRSAFDEPLGEEGRVVVATQVVEAGLDVSATTLITEAAPWSSLVQRAGRCNRAGREPDARVVVVRGNAKKPAPYDAVDTERAWGAALALEERLAGGAVTAEQLSAIEVPRQQTVHQVLRRADLVELFDTTPDLSGADIDVSRWIRDGDDTDVGVVWGEITRYRRTQPTVGERCPVPVGEARDFVKHAPKGSVRRFDHLERSWVPVAPRDLQPGMVLVVDPDAGGYTAEGGWDLASKVRVEPVAVPEEAPPPDFGDLGIDDDPLTRRARWVGLTTHLADAAAEARHAVHRVGVPLPESIKQAVVAGAAWHDIGKAHEVFQASLARTLPSGEAVPESAGEGPWAKSGSVGSLRHQRPHFRHEFASLLALLGAGRPLLESLDEPELVAFLVAAHHGRVRVGARSLPGDRTLDDGRVPMLGVADGDRLPSIELPHIDGLPAGHIPGQELSLSHMSLGLTENGHEPFVDQVLGLLHRADLGPFRLAWLEALVRAADWAASAVYGNAAPETDAELPADATEEEGR